MTHAKSQSRKEDRKEGPLKLGRLCDFAALREENIKEL
jgi:hypothetical protein